MHLDKGLAANDPIISLERSSMFMRIITSGWFAFLAVVSAVLSLYALHGSGRTTEALVGSAVLLVAIILIFAGGKRTPPED